MSPGAKNAHAWAPTNQAYGAMVVNMVGG